MPRKSYDEQIADMEKKLEIQKARLREVKAKKRSEEQSKARKERTHRLIQIGAIVEAAYNKGIKETDPNFKKIDGEEMRQALYEFLTDQDDRGNFFSNKLNAAKGSAAPEYSEPLE